VRWLVVLLSLTSVARADESLRCGQWLIDKGASEAEVGGKCGPPTRADTRHAVWRTRFGTYRCTIDVWTYDGGPYAFVRTLEFHDGTLASISVGDYGN
jgi:Protein of unknown function (DUF2845)